jgi:DNA-directed DNA polymerase III PolC
MLRAKSDFSLGHGCAAPEELARAAHDFGLPALALADVESVAGLVRFHEACRALSVRPVCGAQVAVEFGALSATPSPVLVLVRDPHGYRNLCHILTRRHAQPRSWHTLDVLAEHAQGCFFGSAEAGMLVALLEHGLAREQLCALLTRPGQHASAERSLLTVARERGIRLVADVDVMFARRADHPLHVLVRALSLGKTVEEARRDLTVASPGQALDAPLAEMFSDVPEALAEVNRVLAACSFELMGLQPSLPTLPQGREQQRAMLAARCRVQKAAFSPAHEARLASELHTIETRGLVSYFLMLAELIDELNARDIPHAGRGSAVGSLVAHLIGVSGVDPVAHDLLFERFIHQHRAGFPDVDIDVASHRRDEVLTWLHARFGPHQVAMVATYATRRRRAAYHDALRALGMPRAELARFLAAMPDESLDLPMPALSPSWARFAPWIERLIGRPQHLSVHPGGVVIAGTAISDRAPLTLAPKGVLVTQYDMHAVARLGMLKLDILGNRCLSELQTARELAQTAALDDISDDDPATLTLLQQAQTVGCFQVETPAVRSLLARVFVRGLDDLAGVLALVRPGAAAFEAKANYVRRVHGEETAHTAHPDFAALLGPTKGLFLYEEDVIRALALLLRCPLAEADALRARLVRGTLTIEELTQRLVHAGTESVVALRVARDMVEFATYSFSKAHALAYARLAYLAAYFKTHHAAAFATAVLDHHGGSYPLRTVVSDLMRRGVRFLSPHVHASVRASTLTPEGVRVGLDHVKHLRARSKERIITHRRVHGPFADMEELRRTVPLSDVELSALVLSGACDGLAPLSWENYPFAHEELLRSSPQALLPLEPAPRSVNGGAADANLRTYRTLVRIRHELQLLNMHLVEHPMRVLRPEAERLGTVTTRELSAHVGEHVALVGLVSAMRRLRDGRGELMQFATLEDEHGLVEAVVPAPVFARLFEPIRDPGPYHVRALVMADHGALSLSVEDVRLFAQRKGAWRSSD